MSRSPNPQTGIAIVLYIFGIGLVIVAIIIFLQGLGIISSIPNYVIWALVLLTVGLGILGGLKNIGSR